MTEPRDHLDFDPWEAPLEDLARMAREIEAYGDPKSHDLSTVEARRHFAAHILEVLNARATLEAADRQAETAERIAQASETQAQTAKGLVYVTWWLIGVTALLAAAAIVALFLVPEIVVEVPLP